MSSFPAFLNWFTPAFTPARVGARPRARLRGAFAVAACLVGAIAACSPKPTTSQSEFSGFVADAARDILADAPELDTEAGLTPAAVGATFADRLDERAPLALEIRRGAALRRYAQLRAIDRAALSADERTTYDVLYARFAAAAAGARFSYGQFSAMGDFSPYALNHLDSAFLTLPGFFERDVPVASFADAEHYLRRLAQVAGALDADIERARVDARAGVVAPDFVLDRASAQVSTFLASAPDELPYFAGLRTGLAAIAGPLPAPPAPDTPASAHARALLRRADAIIVGQIIPAYRRTASALAELRARAGGEPGLGRLKDGAAYYQAALKAQTSTDLTPGQIYAIGVARVKALSGEMDMMLRSQGLTDGTVGQRMALLTADPRYAYPATPEGHTQILADIDARLRAVTTRLPRWFLHSPQTRLEVREAPAYAALTVSGGYYEAPPLNLSRPGLLTLNLDARAGVNRIDLPTLTYHEGIPGHHLQIARALERPDTPVLRRLIGLNASTEGWALYGEQLADEMGLYDGDPAGRLGYLRWQIWRAARLVVDTGLHSGHWSKAQAVAYLSETTGDAPGVIDTEVDRYAAMPGQACGYELGRATIVRLRDKARAALGAQFDIRDFHEAVLQDGALPPAALEDHVDAWLARVRSGGGVH